MKFYNFDPKSCKNIYEVNGNNELDEFGENLIIALDHILQDKNSKRMFLNLLKDLLPYLKEINIEDITQTQKMFSIIEKYNNAKLPSAVVSDGTSNLIALIAALYFENGTNIFIEEPERNIHPNLLSKIIEMMVEVSKNKQIIVTTHNPVILKYIDINDLFLISRDKNGYSNITKPMNSEIVRDFIESFGIEDAFIDNLLGVE